MISFTLDALSLWTRVLHEKPPPVFEQLNFPAFYGSRRFITVFTSATGPNPEPDEPSTYHPVLFLFPSGFPTNNFPLLRSFQRIRPSPRPYVTIRNKLFKAEELLAQHPTLKLENHPCRLSSTPYSIYSQLPIISGGRLQLRAMNEGGVLYFWHAFSTALKGVVVARWIHIRHR
jgi:hypothetical protein